MKKLFILDAVNFLFRSYHAIAPMTGPKGQSTHALFGFIRSLLKIVTDFSPDYLIAVFDGPENKKSRTDIYKEYKSHRKAMPEDLFPQLEEAVVFCQLAGIPLLMISGVEADDTIGSLVEWTKTLDMQTYICTSDKDLCQLVSDSTFIVHAHKDNNIVTKEKVVELFGVRPDQIVDYLALIGDASDNIPGVAGIGPKTASTLLAEFGTLDVILEKAHTLSGRKGELLTTGRESAILSKQLATLDISVEVPKDLNFYTVKIPSQENLTQFYRDNRFNSLIKEQDKAEENIQKKEQALIDCKIISTKEELDSLLQALQKETSICLDTKTTKTSPMETTLVGISLGGHSSKIWYLPMNGSLSKVHILDFLSKLFLTQGLSFYSHDIKYALHVLLNEGLPLPKIDFDTMLASYLLTPHILKHGLQELCLEWLTHSKDSIDDLLGKGKNQISMSMVPVPLLAKVAGEDTSYIIQLKDLFFQKLKEQNLLSVLENIEIPLISVLLSIERNGLFLDLPEMRKISHDLSKKLSILETTIHETAGEIFNINSPKQLSHILFEKMGLKPPKKTQTGFSTSAETLESLQKDVPIIASILEYRQLEKLRSTYADALQEQINPYTRRIHCTFNQSVAATGRLSCQSPNLQNIPTRSEEGKKIRAAFRPEKEGWSYVSADYSQIELRLLAHLSEDPMLIKAFDLGEDVHAYTASLIFNTPLDQVTSEMRFRAKAVNFGILYGQQAFGLSQGLSIDYKEAASFIETYFQRYPKVKDYIEFCKESVRLSGVSTTMTGRQRPIPDINSKNPVLKSLADRLAVNTPLQGTAADLIKLAMITIHNTWPFKESFMILQIHDELLFEAPDHEIPELISFVKNHMENVFTLKVPLVVDISVGKNWGAC